MVSTCLTELSAISFQRSAEEKDEGGKMKDEARHHSHFLTFPPFRFDVLTF